MRYHLRHSARAAGVLLATALAGAGLLGTAQVASSEETPDTAVNLLDQTFEALDVLPRIVGGEPAAEGDYPWMVRLDIAGGLCGGALYAPDLVLTAAHCVSPGTGPNTDITAMIGSVDLESEDIVEVGGNHVWSGNAEGIGGGYPDWALIQLDEPVEGVPTLPITTTGEYDEGDFTVAGWGADAEGGDQQQFLLEAEVPFVGDAECLASYPDGEGWGFVGEIELCAGFAEGGIDSCQGDSGGPLFREDDEGETVQVGIVSWGNGCARPDYPGVYTQVSAVAAAIQETAELRTEPEVDATSAETTIDTPVRIELSGTDPEGDDLEFKVYAPEVGELTYEDDPSVLTYTPAEGFEGEDTFYVVVNDGKIDSAPAAVTVTVEGQAPTQEPTPTPTEEPTATPTDDPGDDDGDDQGEELPDTGAGAGPGVALALLLAGGAAVALVARRRLAVRS
ncbi:hypothetical protein HD601_000647 [Jiangella mangrovi]|uniref:Peptidase S1 domain-containing protein n=1 Tax=Jiangella mangrovi TaxID=1524084 RepID=A0A7W9LJJ0_9ACTN|nr:trypsin-like serine protease [Jiangella mangrovi]MBB5786072.1 hypothetical protein [Jiangella mangrovi]